MTFNVITGLLAGGVGICVSLYTAYYLDCHTTILIRLAKTKWASNLLMSATNTVINSNTGSDFKVNANKQSATITYTRLGKEYSVTVPYNHRKISSSTGLQVILRVTEENEVGKFQEVDITQQPGIEFTVTPKQLGGKEVIIRKHGEVISTFSENEKIVV